MYIILNVGINVKRFLSSGVQRGTRFRRKWFRDLSSEEMEKKGPDSVFGAAICLSCKQLNLYCTFSRFFKKYFSYISCVLNMRSCLCNVVSWVSSRQLVLGLIFFFFFTCFRGETSWAVQVFAVLFLFVCLFPVWLMMRNSVVLLVRVQSVLCFL